MTKAIDTPLKKIELPKELTKKHWESKRSVVSKQHKTGVGELLAKLEASFSKLRSKEATVMCLVTGHDLEKSKLGSDKFAQGIHANFVADFIAPLNSHISKASDGAMKAANTFGKSALTSADKKLAVGVVDALKSLKTELDEVSTKLGADLKKNATEVAKAVAAEKARLAK